MDFFDSFTSNTTAGSANQLYFTMKDNEVHTGRVFYKITVGGTFGYSLLFSNVIDSTYADGSISRKNLECPGWSIHSARVGRCSRIDDVQNGNSIEVFDFKDLTFDLKKQKDVKTGEIFCSDRTTLTFREGEYLCLEMTFSGKMIPYHEETLLPVFVKEKNGWTASKHMPFPGMIGCDRPIKKRIAFFGDSITQGCGTGINTYAHWNALLAQRIGKENAYWNLGIGYGRASDAASDGSWMYKAKQNDVIFVCLGVNDVFHSDSAQTIIKDVERIVDILKAEGKTVILQTLPPFDCTGTCLERWSRVNDYIRNNLSSKVKLVFDTVPVLAKNEKEPHMAKYGGHPDAEGCRKWADSLYEAIKDII